MKKTGYFKVVLIVFVLFFAGLNLPAIPLLAAESTAAEASEGPAETAIIDNADLFTPEEEQAINAKLDSLIARTPDCGLAVITTNDTGGKKTRTYGEDIFESRHLGYGKEFNGIFVLIDMQNRQFYVGTFGHAIKVLTDARIQHILDAMEPHMRAHDYAKAVLAGLDEIDYYQEQGVPSNQYEYKENRVFTPLRLIVAAVIFVGVGLTTFIAYRKSIISDYDRYTSRPLYDTARFAAMNLAINADSLVDQNVSRIYSPPPPPSSSASSSGGDSGRSTTHMTGGGHSSGGGGRGF